MTEPTMADFLEGKLKNFQSFLEPLLRDEFKETLNQFKTLDDVITHLLSLTVLAKSDSLNVAVDNLCEVSTEPTDEVKAKILLYFQCFVECVK